MPHMNPQYTEGYVEVELVSGETWYYPARDYPKGADDVVYKDMQQLHDMEHPCKRIEWSDGWLWRLSAPGFLGCTEWSPAATLADAKEDCVDMYGVCPICGEDVYADADGDFCDHCDWRGTP